MSLKAIQAGGVRVGAVIQVVFPLESCSPTYMITSLTWECARLESAKGAVSSLSLRRLHRYLTQGICVVLKHAA